MHTSAVFIKALALPLVVLACNTENPIRNSSSTLPDSVVTEPDTIERVEPVEPNLTLLTPDGWGPLRIGMSRAEVIAAAGEDARPNAVGGPDPEACDEFRPRNAPEGLLAMLESGILTRISVSRNPDIATPEGIHVGDSASTVLAKYGARARVEPHKYSEAPARYITVWRGSASDTARRGIRYEIDGDDDVAHLRAGGPSIEYVEGCL